MTRIIPEPLPRSSVALHPWCRLGVGVNNKISLYTGRQLSVHKDQPQLGILMHKMNMNKRFSEL